MALQLASKVTKKGDLFMIKNYKEQLIVKEWMVEALLKLMAQKNYDDITITEIAKTAGVNRMTYYRNYVTKDDILKKYSEDLSQELTQFIKEAKVKDEKGFLRCLFLFVKGQDTYVQTLIRNHKESLILDVINQNIGQLQLNPQDLIVVRYYAGGTYNVLLSWCKDSYRDNIDSIVSAILDHADARVIQTKAKSYIKTFNKLD